MKITKTLLLLLVFSLAGLAYAQNVAVSFRDATGTTLTRNMLNLEFNDPSYPTGYPAASPAGFLKWRYQMYKDGGDGFISPLSPSGNPTGDDVISIGYAGATGNTQGVITLGPTFGWSPSAAIFSPVGGSGNTFPGDRIFMRIFNANTIATATKTVCFTSLYTITTGSTQNVQPYIPAYAWGPWTMISPPALNPAVLINPADGSSGVAFGGTTLSWAPGTGIAPTGYKVYFGTDTPPTNIVNGLLQTTTTYDTGALITNQTYYWRIVPVADTLEAQNCPIWAFSTSSEINPNPAINPSPANGVTIYTNAFPYDQILTWSPSATGQAPTGYKIYWNGSTTFEDLGNVLTLTKNIPAAATYTWQIVPYYIEPVTRMVKDLKPIAAKVSKSRDGSSRGDALNCPVWSFAAALTIYYTVDITSTPTGAAIYVNGTNSGFTTPHQFSMAMGTGATYTVQMTGYTWLPTSYAVTNIQANHTQNFTGTPQTFNVALTSSPTDADIFVNGVDSGFNTPHLFAMNYGTSATYTVQKTGYTFSPTQLVVTNITSNTAQLFTGTLITFTADITSTPTDADIFLNGLDSGYNTPHTFTMNYGSGATYTVQKTGYTFAPDQFVVTNITANTSQEFIGTINVYNVDITSTPTDADIFVDGTDSGFNTPHTFAMNYGTSSTYTVQMTGYVFTPAQFVVTNISANLSQLFTGAVATYTVNITSTPADADIFVNGTDSGFNTPHVFSMEYGTSATYTVQKAGYSFAPAQFVVTNITANQSQNFVGTIFTYTVDITSTPTGADIFVNGVDSGFNTPHTFTMDFGTSATYTVQMAGYSFAPAQFVVTNITANMSQAFTGTLNTYTVNVTSAPTNAAIYVNGTASGFNTPHIFTMDYNTSATYMVQLAGYIFAPVDYPVNNITANVAINFVGTLITLLVTPSNQDVSYEAGSTTFDIDSNYNWAASTDATWISIDPMTGTNDGTITVNFTLNPVNTPRTGVITVTAGILTHTVTVTQAGNTAVGDEVEVLHPNLSVYPNPFSAMANIKVDVKTGSPALVEIYSIKGQRITSLGTFQKGTHTVAWNGKDEAGKACSSGFYLVKYSSKDWTHMVKVMLVR